MDSFSIFQFGSAHEIMLHDVVGLEHLSDESYVEDDTDTHQFSLAFNHLSAEALSLSESRDLILTTSRQYGIIVAQSERSRLFNTCYSFFATGTEGL